LALQPLINDLRTIREVPLLAETALFFPNLKEAELPPGVMGSPNPELPETARQLRPAFHRAQLNWYRGLEPKQGLSQLRGVIADLRSKAGTGQVYRLFQVAQALASALEEASIEAGARVKQLLARLDRQIKRIIDAGEGGVEDESLTDLTKTMLYYLAGAKSADADVQAVQQMYGLENALPDQELLSAVREELSAPSQEMLKTVFGAVQEDLLKVKDRLDLFMRDRDKRMEDLVALAEPMRTVADTLGMIGQGALRVRLLEELENLHQAEEAGYVPDEDVLMEMAGAILFVENALRSAGDGTRASGRDPSLIIPIMRETRAEIMRAKDAIMVFVAEPEILEAIRDVPAWLYNIAGSFRILELPEPAEILDQLSAYLKQRVLATGNVPERGQLEAYADAVSAIEYFAESLVEGRGDAAQRKILDTARAALDRLHASESASAAPTAEPPSAASAEAAATVESVEEAEVVDHELF
jgi:chemosensory pili system protein ChpA (sensor histidine kinase/response regulator)